MLLYVNMLCAAHDGFSSAIHRYIAANVQIKNEKAKKKGEKLAWNIIEAIIIKKLKKNNSEPLLIQMQLFLVTFAA